MYTFVYEGGIITRENSVFVTRMTHFVLCCRHNSSMPPFEDRMRSTKYMHKVKTTAAEVKPRTDKDHLVNCWTLPPLVDKKVQGPFKPLSEVWRQRLTPLNPTLRVATAYDSEEVAR